MNRLYEFSSRFRILKGGKISLVVSALLGSAIIASAAPTGGVVTSGNATINQNGDVTNINQSSSKATINWNDFSIKSKETVNFNQPDKNSITLNRVVGNEKSVIDGALNANGQVWILNSNGTIFGKEAKVNTSGLLVTTKELSDEDFNKGNYNFKGNSKESVENNGSININDKAYAAFIANAVKNNGKIEVYQGTINLVGANEFSLNLDDKSAISLKVTKGALDALVENNNILKADGGRVYLTTNAKDELLKGVVNNTGIIEANSIDNLKSEVVLYAHGGTTNVNGTIKAKDGFVETSGKNLNVTNESTIEAKKWLLDPENVTIDDGNGAIGGSSVGASVIQKALNGSVLPAITPMDVEIQADNNIDVNADISYGRSTLTLNAGNSVNINKTITLTRDFVKDESGLIIKYAQKVNTGDYYVNNTNGNTGKVNLAVTSSFKTQKGTDALKNYTIITSLGNAGSVNKTDLQGMNGDLNGNYVLGADIDASATSGWNSAKGFKSIGGSSIVDDNKTFNGIFDGLGHTITKLTTINDSLNTYGFVGLFGSTSNTADIRNIGLIDTVAKSYFNTGSLVGSNAGRIYNSYSTGTGLVSGSNHIGGLVGNNAGGQILNSYTSIKVEGANQNIGGLVGLNNSGGSISNSYSSSSVSGNAQKIGGLVGLNVVNATINDSNSTANVQGNNTSGGLVGENQGEINNSFSKATVNSTGINTGGFAGINAGVINNSYIDGGSFTASNNTAGGFVGWNQGNGKINNSYSNTTVTSSGEQNVGGFAGANDGTISNSYSNANIELNALNISNIGGLVGKNNGTINSNSYAKANLKTLQSNGTYIAVGGLVGLNSASGKIDGSNSENNLNFNADALGGLVGSNLGNITNSFSTGAIKSSRFFGGLAGENIGTITSSYSTVSLTGLSYFGGLVGENTGGTINNSSYKDGTVYGTNTQFGGLVGGNTNGGKIINSTSSGNLEGRAAANLFGIGGLVGLNDAISTIDSSSSTISMVLDNISINVGGLVGNNSGTITNSNTNLTMEAGSSTGGLVGNNRGSITNSFSAGTIKATDTVGGLVGTNSLGGIIDGTYSNSKITATSNNIGGLVGANAGEIKNSYIKDATLSATGNTVGGFIGWNRTTGNITNSNSTIVVTSTTGSKIGGFIGANDGTIQNSYTTGAVTGNTSVGGFVGENSGKIYASNSTGAVTGKTTVGGFVGRNFGANGEIEYSYTFGKTDGGTNVGGFAGINTAIIRNTYTTGNVSGNSIVSSFVGKNEGGSVINSYARGTILGATSYGFAGDNAGVISDSYYNLTQNPLKDDEALYGKVIGELKYGGLYKRADWNITSDASLNIDTPVIKFDANNKGYWAIAPIVANYELGDYGVDYKGDYYNLSQTYTTPFKNFQFLENSLDYEFVRGGATVTQYRDVGKYDNIGVKSTNEFLIIPETGNINGAFTINRVGIIIKANNDSKVYNGSNQTMSGFTVTGLKGTDTKEDLEVTGDSVTGKDVGIYNTTLGATNNNYSYTFQDGQLSITKAKATLKGDTKTFEYNGANQTISDYTIDGLLGSDTQSLVTVTGNEVTGKDVGVYNTNLDATATNYFFDVIDGALTIVKAGTIDTTKVLKVTANSDKKEYNGLTQTVSGYTLDGLMGDDLNSTYKLSDVKGDSVGAKNVGVYATNLSGTDKNYVLAFENGALTIVKAGSIDPSKKLIVTANSAETTYNGKEQSVTGFEVQGLLGSDTKADITGVIGDKANGKDAGSYKTALDGSDDNYELVFVDGTLKINKAKATVTVKDETRVYDGYEQELVDYTVSGLVGDDTTIELTDLDGSLAKGKDVGTYTTNLSGSDENYDLTFVNGALKITKADLIVRGNSATYVYDGAEKSVNGYTLNGLLGTDTASVVTGVTGDTATGTNVGTYNMSMADGISTNYNLIYEQGSLRINKADAIVAVVTGNSASYVYDGTEKSVSGYTISTQGVLSTKQYDDIVVYGDTAKGKDVGTYYTNLSGTSTNYNLTFVNGELKITKAKAIVTGVSERVTYDGSEQAIEGYTVTGLVNGENKGVLDFIDGDTIKGTNAGTYSSNLTGYDKNYDLTFVDGTLTIDKAKAIVVGKKSEVEYNGSYQNMNGYLISGLVGNDTESVVRVYGDDVTGKNVGVYTTDLRADADNYTFDYENGALTIVKAGTIDKTKVLKVTANSGTKEYNGLTQTVSGYTLDGLLLDDTNYKLSNVIGDSASGKNVGTYSTNLSGTDINYELEFVDGTLNIVKLGSIDTTKKLKVIANSAIKEYNGNLQEVIGFEVTGLVGDDTKANITGITGDKASGTNVGIYNTALAGTNQNYELEFVNGNLDIRKLGSIDANKKLKVTANSSVVEYNGKEQSVTGYSISGFVGNDTKANITGITGDTATGTNVGIYNTALAGSDENYELEFVNGKLDIRKLGSIDTTKVLKVIANSDTKEYNGTTQTVSGYTLDGLLADDINYKLSNVTGDSVSGKNVGVYNTNLSGTDTNYVLSFVNGALTIVKAGTINENNKLIVTANSDKKEYNGTTQTVSGYTLSGLMGDDLNSTYKLSNVTGDSASGKNVGVYNTKLQGTDTNYVLVFVDGALNIVKAGTIDSTKVLKVTANSDKKVYNGKEQEVTGYKIEGLLGEDKDNYVLNITGDKANGKDVGIYNTKLEGMDQNYNLTFVDGKLEITPAKLIVKANDDTKEYDGLAYYGGNGVTYDGFVNNETQNVLSGNLVYGGDSQGAVKMGRYDITPSGLDAKNYVIAYQDGELTIKTGNLDPEDPEVAPIVPENPGNGENPDSPDRPEGPTETINDVYYNGSNKAEQATTGASVSATLCYDETGTAIDTVSNNLTRLNSDLKSVLICKTN